MAIFNSFLYVYQRACHVFSIIFLGFPTGSSLDLREVLLPALKQMEGSTTLQLANCLPAIVSKLAEALWAGADLVKTGFCLCELFLT